jgi:GT2 family glycosyltransferase
MISQVRLSIVIVNYKTSNLVFNCIKTLIKQVDHNQDRIIIVDNNSGNNESEIINKYIEDNNWSTIVSVISSPRNGGFSYGNNLGIQAIDSKYYLLANGDTLFLSGSIAELIKAAQLDPVVGIISPRLEWENGDGQISCFKYHTPIYELICSAGTGLITSLFKCYNIPLPLVDQISYPKWTSFACVLIKKEVFQKIGYLDEGYFMYYEDVDFCRRAMNYGFKVLNWPDAHVVHLRGQSSGVKKMSAEKARLPRYMYESRARYYVTYYGYFGFILSNFCWLLGRMISFGREILMGKSLTVPKYQFLDIWKK